MQLDSTVQVEPPLTVQREPTEIDAELAPTVRKEAFQRQCALLVPTIQILDRKHALLARLDISVPKEIPLTQPLTLLKPALLETIVKREQVQRTVLLVILASINQKQVIGSVSAVHQVSIVDLQE